MAISRESVSELHWWIKNLDNSFNVLQLPLIQLTIATDASLLGWGAVLGNRNTGGRWLPTESVFHINVLELLAVFYALKSFGNEVAAKHVKFLIDNTTAVATINNMGSCHSRDCHAIVCKIWEFCIQHNVWISAAHIPGIDNVAADIESLVNSSVTIQSGNLIPSY